MLGSELRIGRGGVYHNEVTLPSEQPSLLGRFLARGIAAKAYEHSVKERTVVFEFESLANGIAAHDGPEYQAALAVLGNGAERDLRIVEGTD